MEKTWTVEQCTGERADLRSGTERKEVRRPKDMSRGEFIAVFTPGTTVEDGVLIWIRR